ncbi:MAG: metalloregulator ArsR/SmtB family transcription factor [Acidobacteriota bacterium]
MSRHRSSLTLARPKSSARLFAALGDETRLRLVGRLCDDGPMSITGLAGGFNVTRQAISKHLRLMESVGLVCSARLGRQSIWRLSPQRLAEARHYLQLITNQCDGALQRLRKFVED